MLSVYLFCWLPYSRSLLQCVASAIIAPSLHYITRQVALSWRERLSKHLYALFFRHNAFYKAVHVYPGASQPDQRITEDLDRVSYFHYLFLFPAIAIVICIGVWSCSAGG
jgi:ABC-type uncharacterized transport system fused permease/ATPase subunit